jgi:hypothetical protein
MKFKLGLLLGGAIGYLIGSGKGAEMWSDYRARSGAGAGQSLSNLDPTLDFTTTTPTTVTEAFIVSSESSVAGDL